MGGVPCGVASNGTRRHGRQPVSMEFTSTFLPSGDREEWCAMPLAAAGAQTTRESAPFSIDATIDMHLHEHIARTADGSGIRAPEEREHAPIG
jgi:hypothetical protein